MRGEELAQRCEAVYAQQRVELEAQHSGKLVALFEHGVAAIADSIDAALHEASERYPDQVFYVRRIGRHAAAGVLF